VIDVKLKYEPHDDGIRFLEIARQTIQNAGFEFHFETLADVDDERSGGWNRNAEGLRLI
jgi:hypothetical protein